jgi:hypothetical protein
MRFFVPKKVYRLEQTPQGVWYLGGTLQQGQGRYYLSLHHEADEVEIDDPGYFWCTHHYEFNDCVHSKTIAGDGQTVAPYTVDRFGYLYPERFCISTGLKTIRHGVDLEYVTNTKWYSMGPWAYRISITINDNGGHAELAIYDHKQSTNRLYWYGGSNNYIPGDVQITWSGQREVLWEYDSLGREVAATNWYKPNTMRFYYNRDRIGLFQPLCEQLGLPTLISVGKTFRREWEYPLGVRTLVTQEWYLYDEIFDILSQIALSMYRDDLIHHDGWRSRVVYWPQDFYDVNVVELRPASDYFLFNEPELYQYGMDPMIVGHGYERSKDFSGYWRNILIQQAYLDCLQSVPRLNDNSISNLIEIVGFVKALVVDHKIEIPKSLSGAWLSYRYQYTTGKLDAQEAIDFVHRRISLGDPDKWIQSFGHSSISYETQAWSTPITVSCRCCLDIRPRDIATFAKIWRALYTYGLQPSFYVIWDMIPYSFIVDWFLPIGDLASVLDAERMYNETYYEIDNIQFSFSYDITDADTGMIHHQYTRFLSPGVVTLNGFYFFEEDPVSTKVIGYRVLDALSLILGKRRH